MAGRPSKLSDERTGAALLALEHGCTREAAAGAAGVHRVTFYRWIEADATFRTEVEKAEDRAEAAFTLSVVAAVPKNWQAAAWWLERRRHLGYGRKDQVAVTLDYKSEAQRVAAELGLDEATVLSEVERILAR